jgi:hypothetical protein
LEPDLDYASVGKRNKGLAANEKAVPSRGTVLCYFRANDPRFFGMLSLWGIHQRRLGDEQ